LNGSALETWLLLAGKECCVQGEMEQSQFVDIRCFPRISGQDLLISFCTEPFGLSCLGDLYADELLFCNVHRCW